MRKNLLLIPFIFLFLFCFSGCLPDENKPITESKTLRLANAIYMDIRIVVTDPEILPMFSPKELEKLEDLETKYLEIVQILQEYPNNDDALQQLVWISTEVLSIFNEVTFLEKARIYVTGIRISIQILRNHLL